MTENQVREILAEECKKLGSQEEWCRLHGVSKSNVSDFLRGVIGPGPKILDPLNIKKKTVFFLEKPFRKESDGV